MRVFILLIVTVTRLPKMYRIVEVMLCLVRCIALSLAVVQPSHCRNETIVDSIIVTYYIL